MRKILRFISDEKGTTSIEYALIGFLIAVVVASTVSLVGEKVKSLYEAVLSCFS